MNQSPEMKSLIQRTDAFLYPEVNDLHFISFNETSIVEIDSISLDELTTHLSDNHINWLNINGLRPKSTIYKLCDMLGVDEDIAHDITETTIRSKFQNNGNYIFFNIKSIIPGVKNKVEYEQMSFLLFEDSLISIQERAGDDFDPVREEILKKHNCMKMESDLLMFKLLDELVNQYYQILDELTITTERISNFETDQSIELKRNVEIESTKRKVYRLKKVVSPMKEMLTFLEKSESQLIHIENDKFIEDIKEHCIIILEETDYLMERLDSASNLFFSLQNQKLNNIMKTLTIITAIFTPLAFVTGWYGMNFVHMPELQWEHPYVYLFFLVSLIVGFLLYFFKKKHWI